MCDRREEAPTLIASLRSDCTDSRSLAASTCWCGSPLMQRRSAQERATIDARTGKLHSPPHRAHREITVEPSGTF